MSRHRLSIGCLALLFYGCGQGSSGNNETQDPPRPDAGITDAADPGDAARDVTSEPDLGERSCIELGCVDDPGGPLCDEASGACVMCLDSTNCAEPVAPICRSGACEGCQTSTQCQTAGLGEVCRSDGRCVACERDDDCPATAPFSPHRAVYGTGST